MFQMLEAKMKNIFLTVAVIFGVCFPAHANDFADNRTYRSQQNFLKTQFFECNNNKEYFLSVAKTRVQKIVDLVNSNTADYENGAGGFTGKKTAKSFFGQKTMKADMLLLKLLLKKTANHTPLENI